MKPLVLISLVSLSACLAACGEDSGGVNSVASTPAPLPGSALAPLGSSPLGNFVVETSRTPLPPTPATTTGTYQGIAAYSAFTVDANGSRTETVPLQLAPAGSATLGVDAASRTYTLTVTAGPTVFAPAVLSVAPTSPLGFHVEGYDKDAPTSPVKYMSSFSGIELHNIVAAGTTSSGAVRRQSNSLGLANAGYVAGVERYLFSAAPHYVSLAQWTQAYSDTGGTSGVMVFGPRTAPSDIPLSGVARYAVTDMPIPSREAICFEGSCTISTAEPETKASLSVDFASKLLTAEYSVNHTTPNYQVDQGGAWVLDADGNQIVAGQSVTAILATGSTTITTTGDFSLGLTGTGTLHSTTTGLSDIDLLRPVSGSLTGAFFGPQAAEVGGIWTVPTGIGSDGSVTSNTGAFVGIRN
jgi:hypothetical protein